MKDPSDVVSFRFSLPPGYGMPVHSVAVSPDGSFVVAGASGSEIGAAGLFLRELGGLGVEQIAGTDAGFWPFISPDAAWVGFSTVTALLGGV